MADHHTIHLTINGRAQQCSVAPRTHLVDLLREQLGLTGSHLGCEHGVCGACTVEVDGRIVRGCLTLAVQANGGTVSTIEGLSRAGVIRDLRMPSCSATPCSVFLHRAC
jgi:carbon-monoxide dehydrogenase small subunit